MQQIAEASLAYYSQQQCSEQWRVFITALADELTAQMALAERRQLMHALGERMATKLTHSNVNTLAELEKSINELWSQMQWGYVSLYEQADSIGLTHFCSPLRHAFGADAMQWAPALLQGVYARWFSAFGAGDDLQLRQVAPAQGGDDAIEFKLGRANAMAHPAL